MIKTVKIGKMGTINAIRATLDMILAKNVRLCYKILKIDLHMNKENTLYLAKYVPIAVSTFYQILMMISSINLFFRLSLSVKLMDKLKIN